MECAIFVRTVNQHRRLQSELENNLDLQGASAIEETRSVAQHDNSEMVGGFSLSFVGEEHSPYH